MFFNKKKSITQKGINSLNGKPGIIRMNYGTENK